MFREDGGAQGRSDDFQGNQGEAGFQPIPLTDASLPSPAGAFSNLRARAWAA